MSIQPLLTCAVALLLGLAFVPYARAQDPEVRRMRFVERGDSLHVHSQFTELFDQEDYEDLSSGVPTTVAIAAYVYARDSKLPVAAELVTFRVVYDLWDEVYVMRSEGSTGSRIERLSDRIEVLERMSSLEGVAVAPLAKLARGPHYFLALEAQLNPIGEERLAEMRRWLTKSTSESRLDSSSSFFGSFVSVFVNPKLQKADRVLRLRSQYFYRRKKRAARHE